MPSLGSDVKAVIIGQAKVGLAGLEEIFEALADGGREPSDGLGEDLVDLVGKRNYVPASARAEYARALLVEYRRHLGEDVPDERGILSIRILGAGCPNCEQLASNVMAALAKLNVAADVEHVREPARIGEYGVVGTPALVVNGEVKARGRALSIEEVERLIKEGATDA